MIRIIVFALMFPLFLISQDFDKLMYNKPLECSDVSYNSSLLFQKYFEMNRLDSAEMLLKYWEDKCGMNEPIQRAKIILALKQNTFNDSILNESILSKLIIYNNRIKLIQESENIDNSTYSAFDLAMNNEYNKIYFSYVPIGKEFDKFTSSIAKSLKNNYKSGTSENLFCEFYGDNSDTIFSKIQDTIFKNSKFSNEYNTEIEKLLNEDEYNVSFITGLWIPQSGFTDLDSHFELGFQMGKQSQKVSYDLTLIMRINNSNEYDIAQKLNPYDTTMFAYVLNGIYLGFDLGADIIDLKRTKFKFLAGFAFDGFNYYQELKPSEYKCTPIWGFNINLGLGLRAFSTSTFYMEFQVKYNIMNYFNNIIGNNGNTVSVHFMLGSQGNTEKQKRLEYLKYDYR